MSEHVLSKIHDCTFRPKYFIHDFLDPKFPENFHFISHKFCRRHQIGLFFDFFSTFPLFITAKTAFIHCTFLLKYAL